MQKGRFSLQQIIFIDSYHLLVIVYCTTFNCIDNSAGYNEKLLLNCNIVAYQLILIQSFTLILLCLIVIQFGL